MIVAVASLCVLHAGAALAVPMLSLDVDPGAAGIQDTLDVGLGDAFTVDVFVSGIEAGAPLNGFELDLFFDSSVVTARSVTGGDLLLSPVFTLQERIGAVSVEFAEVSLAPGGGVGDGVLATILFEATGLGASVLDLDHVILAAPFGRPIDVGGVFDGRVRVVQGGGAAPVPEPTGLALFTGGLWLLGTRIMRIQSRAAGVVD